MIYAIVMAGGRGTRLKVDVEKPLFKLHGKPLIKYVLDNISSSGHFAPAHLKKPRFLHPWQMPPVPAPADPVCE